MVPFSSPSKADCLMLTLSLVTLLFDGKVRYYHENFFKLARSWRHHLWQIWINFERLVMIGSAHRIEFRSAPYLPEEPYF